MTTKIVELIQEPRTAVPPSTGGSSDKDVGSLQLTMALVAMLKQVLSTLEKQANNNSQSALFQADMSTANMKALEANGKATQAALKHQEHEQKEAKKWGLVGAIFGACFGVLMTIGSLGLLAPEGVTLTTLAISSIPAVLVGVYGALGGFSSNGLLSNYISCTSSKSAIGKAGFSIDDLADDLSKFVDKLISAIGKEVDGSWKGTKFFEDHKEILRVIGEVGVIVGAALASGAASSSLLTRLGSADISAASSAAVAAEEAGMEAGAIEMSALGQEAAPAAQTVADMTRQQALQQSAKAVGNWTAFTTGLSSSSQSDIFTNLAMVILDCVPNTSKEKKQEVQGYIAMALTIIAMIVGTVVMAKCTPATGALLDQDITQKMTTMRQFVGSLGALAGIGEATAQVGQGVTLLNQANITYELAKLMADASLLSCIGNTVQQIQQSTSDTTKMTSSSISRVIQGAAQYAAAQREASKVLLAVSG